jgi:hypothetical protein
MSNERCPENYTVTHHPEGKIGHNGHFPKAWDEKSGLGPHHWTYVTRNTHDLTKFGHGYSTVTVWRCNYCRKEDEIIKHYSLLRDDELPPPLDIPERT